MEEKKLNEAESIELIARMIRNTRNYMEQNVGRSFVVMGYLTVATAIAVWAAVRLTGDFRWQWLWFAIPAGWLLDTWLHRYDTRHVVTFVDRAIGYVWAVLGLIGFTISMLSFAFPLPILTIILLLMGAGTAITGLITRFRTLTATGLFSALVLAPVCNFLQIDACLVFAAAFALMMILPGHLLNRLSKR